MEPWAWWTIAGLCVSGAMSPGPSLAVVVKNTVEGGRARGIATGVGHGLGVGLYAFGAVAGVSAVLQSWPRVEQALTLIGGVYLVWLGIGALRSVRGDSAPGPPEQVSGGFREGFLTAFLNPKIALFFLALLSSFVPDAAGFSTRAGVGALACAIDMGWYVTVAAVLARTRAMAWLGANRAAFVTVTGTLLVGGGCWVLWHTLTRP